MKQRWVPVPLYRVAESTEIDWKHLEAGGAPPSSSKTILLDLRPPEGCALGLAVFEDTLFIHDTFERRPTDLDRERWAALTGEPPVF